MPLCINARQASEGELEISLYPRQNTLSGQLEASRRTGEKTVDMIGRSHSAFAASHPRLSSLLREQGLLTMSQCGRPFWLASLLGLPGPRLREGAVYKRDLLTLGPGGYRWCTTAVVPALPSLLSLVHLPERGTVPYTAPKTAAAKI